MSAGVGFALVSLAFAGVLDVVFKRYSRKDRSRGTYLLIAGAVWTALQLGMIAFRGIDSKPAADAMLIAAAAGVVIALANILFIESLTHIHVSLAATIYRLNTIGVVVLAVAFLGEPLTPLKLLGVGLGAIAVLTLYEGGFGTAPISRRTVFFALAVAASLLRAGWGVILKAGSLHAVDPQLMMLASGLGFMAVGAAYALVWEGRMRVTGKKLAYGGLTGGLIFLVANALMLAIERAEASVVVPIANMSFLVSVALSAGLKMEALTRRKALAMGCAAVAIVILART
ncbi:MAG: EamA family transporter [Pseudomonadota bacterium]